MRVEHQARGGHVTERFAPELEARHMDALSEFYLSLFNTDDARTSDVGEALWAIHKAWKLHLDGALFAADSVGTMARPTENAPASRKRSGADPRGVSS